MSKLDELWNEAYRLGYAHAYEEREAFEKAADALEEKAADWTDLSEGGPWDPPEPPKPVEAPYTIGGKYTREQAWAHTFEYGSTWGYTDPFGKTRSERWDETHRAVRVVAEVLSREPRSCSYLVSEYRTSPWTLLDKGTDRR